MKDPVLLSITSVTTNSASLNIVLLFQKNPVLTLKQPHNLLLWANSDHMPWRKSKPGFRTLAPACLPKLQTTCIFFFFNSKHEITTFQSLIRQLDHEWSVSYHWSRAVLRHLIHKENCQMGHEQPLLPNL